MQFKSCRRCGIVKPSTDFYKNKTNQDGLYNNCKACFGCAPALRAAPSCCGMPSLRRGSSRCPRSDTPGRQPSGPRRLKGQTPSMMEEWTTKRQTDRLMHFWAMATMWTGHPSHRYAGMTVCDAEWQTPVVYGIAGGPHFDKDSALLTAITHC